MKELADLGAQVIIKNLSRRSILFFAYVFFLIIVYMTLHYGYENTMARLHSTEDELQGLKTEYIVALSTLASESSEEEVEKRLRQSRSALKRNTAPFKWLKWEEDGKARDK